MAIPSALRTRLSQRLASLQDEGEEVVGTVKSPAGAGAASQFQYRVMLKQQTDRTIDLQGCLHWMTRCATTLGQVIPPLNPNRDLVGLFASGKYATAHGARVLLARLKAIRRDFDEGFLDDQFMLLRAEVASDYLAQAAMLEHEGYHVPAAVLAGAVLEEVMRKLCNQHGIDTLKANGDPKTINPMNDDLKKANLYNEARAAEIRHWAAVRNHAAHGEHEKIRPDQVNRMIAGVRSFLAEHVR